MKDAHSICRRLPHFTGWNGIVRCGVPSIVLLANSVFGQAVDQPADAISEEIIQLPPFLVGPTEGWTATETLSGTRLRTPYRDLATQIEVLTPDFLEDFAVNSVEEASIYTLNVESLSEYPANDGYPEWNQGDFYLDGGLRIRGLDTVNNTRLFFTTLLPADYYNVQRAEVSSGPNSILFATRGHAGAVNTDPAPAVFRNGGHFGAQFDSNGSMRFHLNYNQVLARDKLAVRGAVLYEDGEYEIQPSSKLHRRIYGTATWKPFMTTSVRAYVEFVELENHQPVRSLPFDEVSPWIEASNLPESGYSINRPIFQNDLTWQEAGSNIDNNQNVFRLLTYTNPILSLNSGPNGRDAILAAGATSVEVKPLWLWPHLSDVDFKLWRTFKDASYFPTDVNVSGDIRFLDADGHILDLVVNQQILESLHLEIAAHTEKMEAMEAWGLANRDFVKVDANAYLPDGTTPNPNVGRFYLEGPVRYDAIAEATDQARAALSYEHDFEESHNNWMRWLGRHRLVGLASMERSETKHQVRYYRIVPEKSPDESHWSPKIIGVNWDPGNTSTEPTLVVRHYLDRENGRFTASLPFEIGQPFHLVDSEGRPFTIDPENTGFEDQGRRLTTGATINNLRWMEDALQFSYQGYFLDNRLIFSDGWRTIDFNTADFPSAPDPITGMVVHQDDAVYNDYVFFDGGTTSTKGIVLAPFRGWLDLPGKADLMIHHQKSNTFQPKDRPYDPFGNRYPGANGEGEDTGFTLSFGPKNFTIRFNYYKITEGPVQFGGNGFIPRIIGIIENRIRQLDPYFPRLEGDTEYAFPSALPHQEYRYKLVADKESTGYEISGYWAANRNLEFRFNATDVKVVQSNTGLEWWDWMDLRLQDYEDFEVPEGGVENPRDVDGDGEENPWTWWTAPSSATNTRFTLAEYWEAQVINADRGKYMMQAKDGKSDPFIRDLRFNVNGMYRFNEGLLEGLNLGGALRWRESPLLAYEETDIQGNAAPDLEKPLFGETEWYLDLVARYRFEMAWLGSRATTVSLNVRNALDRNDPVPYALDVNGNPTRLMRVEGRKFILSFKVEL